MPEAVLIDAPLWLAYFRDGSGRWAGTVAEFLDQGTAVICGSIVAELLAEAAHADAAVQLGEALRGLTHLPMTDEVFRYAGEMAVALRAADVVLPLPRLLAASAATLHHAALLAAEPRLHTAARLRPLKLLCV
jgi:predicted nucleic acid-binding protein